VLELAAREKLCEYPGQACHGEACPRARGFYDRLPDARAEAVQVAALDVAALRRIAGGHQVCPYFLAQELVRWCDVVIGDYNYFFDGSAFLHALTQDEEWRVALLVDESPNLLERARGMYSAQLPDLSAEPLRGAPAAIRRALAALERERALLQRDQETDYQAHDQIPERFERSLQEAVSAMAEHFTSHQTEAHGPLQQCFFDLLAFARLAETFGRHSVFESRLGPGGDLAGDRAELSIRNLVPGPFLQSRFDACSSAACFSGTLAPFAFYRDMLGLPDNTATLDVASPFHSEQLQVRVAMDLSTRWRDRGRSLGALNRAIAAQFARKPGNYLAFFGSFDYLANAAAAFAASHPEVPIWSQARGMAEAQRDAFLARFVPGGRGIGFAVLGGAFSEGVDLPGDRLVGAFVASLGLPQHDEPNELMRERMEALFGQGYDYTYLYPGLQKVVQAAGRVIRAETDEGVLFLLDDRFARDEIRALLPPWWNLRPMFVSGRRAKPPDLT
jgi:DNA excision repair protein ERCC-2